MSEAPAIDRKSKIVYIDHLRVALTALVILHHTAVGYGAPGGWYYSQKSEFIGAQLPMTILVSVNQAFFMGFFFFLSALFIPSSFDKKGSVQFMSDRLLRLGLPLLFYSFVLSPFLSFMVYYGVKGHHITYLQYLGGFDSWIDFGVMWFVAALLLFTILYAIYRAISGPEIRIRPLPTVARILGFAIIIGVLSFAVRIVFPIGRTLEPLGFQLGHFPQYIAMFILGIITSRSKWLESAPYQMGKQMRTIALCIVLIGFPLFFIARKTLNFPVEYFTSGFHWQSLWYAVWEQLVGFTIVTALLCIGKNRWDIPSKLMATLARSTFAAYIFHPLILIALSVAFHNWAIEPGLKFLMVGPLAVAGTFLLALLLVKIPVVNKVI